MPEDRLQFHLVKCPDKKKKADQFASCPYNARHIVPKSELTYHSLNCPDRVGRIYQEDELDKKMNEYLQTQHSQQDSAFWIDGDQDNWAPTPTTIVGDDPSSKPNHTQPRQEYVFNPRQTSNNKPKTNNSRRSTASTPSNPSSVNHNGNYGNTNHRSSNGNGFSDTESVIWNSSPSSPATYFDSPTKEGASSSPFMKSANNYSSSSSSSSPSYSLFSSESNRFELPKINYPVQSNYSSSYYSFDFLQASTRKVDSNAANFNKPVHSNDSSAPNQRFSMQPTNQTYPVHSFYNSSPLPSSFSNEDISRNDFVMNYDSVLDDNQRTLDKKKKNLQKLLNSILELEQKQSQGMILNADQVAKNWQKGDD